MQNYSVKLSRELKGLSPSDEKFKLYQRSDIHHSFTHSSSQLVNIDILNCATEVQAVCSFCKVKPLQFVTTNLRGVCRDLDLACTSCSNKDYERPKEKKSNGRGNSSTNNAANVHLILASYNLGKVRHAIAVLARACGLHNVTGVNGMFYKYYDQRP